MVWSPAACSNSGSASMVARLSSKAGARFAPWCQGTQANLSVPLAANFRHTSSWSAARILMHTAPAARIAGQLVDVSAGQNDTYGGSSDTDVTDWQVNPNGRAPS